MTSEAKKRAIRRKLCNNWPESKAPQLKEKARHRLFPGIYSHLPCWDHPLQETTLILFKPPSLETPPPADLRATFTFKHSVSNHQTSRDLLPQPTRGPPRARPQPSGAPLAATRPPILPMDTPHCVLVLPPGSPRWMVLQAETHPTSNSEGNGGPGQQPRESGSGSHRSKWT